MLPRDRDGSKFVFAPLGGTTFTQTLGDEQRTGLPDSTAVVTADGSLLVKSTAALYLLRRLGGAWGLAGTLGRLAPRVVRDFVYDRVAAVRHKLFKKPDDACPLVPPELRDRFKP